jgi:hypothetical protein
MLNKVHLTVPENFRPSVIPKSVVLHRENRNEGDLGERDGLRVVRPFLAVLDLLREGRVSVEHIERGFKDGIRTGAITITEVKKTKLPLDERQFINAWLKAAT